MTQQLTLGLRLHDEDTFANFLPGDNDAVIDALYRLLQGSESYIYLWGSEGVGRSHLLQACCHYSFNQKSVIYLPLGEPNIFPEVLEDLENVDFVCLDDIHRVLGHFEWEEALFHFYNRSRAKGNGLLISGDAAPKHLKSLLPDLQSRLASGLILQCQALTDMQKIEALRIRAHFRGIPLAEDVASYLLHHHSRDMKTLLSVLNHLDKASLAAKRRLTIPFVKSVL